MFLVVTSSCVVTAAVLSLSNAFSQNRSCADWMNNTFDYPLDDGYYAIKNNNSEEVTVYCHFNYTSQYAYTLIESFYYDADWRFDGYSFIENYPYNEDDVELYKDTEWRLGMDWIRWIYYKLKDYYSTNSTKIIPRKLVATCNFDMNFDKDFWIINLDNPDLSYHPLFDSGSSYECLETENVNIRGYSICDNVTSPTVYAYYTYDHLKIRSTSSYCSCNQWASSASSYYEDSFGNYYYSNSLFSCTQSSYSTTNWWLARYVENIDYASLKYESEPINKYRDYMYFGNVTCDNINTAEYYKYYSGVKLDKCLNKCSKDCLDNNDTTSCRYAVYDDYYQECYLFSAYKGDNTWCDFTSDTSSIVGSGQTTVYIYDYDVVKYDLINYWYDASYYSCDDYVNYGWCQDGELLRSWDEVKNLRDSNSYNLTAVDVCGECGGGGISEYNLTNISTFVVTPNTNTFDIINKHNGVYDTSCNLTFDDIKEYYVEKFFEYANESFVIEEFGHNNYSLATENDKEWILKYIDYNDTTNLKQIEFYDKASIYSMCKQLQYKISQFYLNKENYQMYFVLNNLFDCAVTLLPISTTQTQTNTISDSVQIKIHFCDYKASDYIQDNSNSNSNSTDMFLFYLGIDANSTNNITFNINTNNFTFNNSEWDDNTADSYNVSYNLYINKLWSDTDSFIDLMVYDDNTIIIDDVSYDKCYNEITNQSINSYTMTYIPCNINLIPNTNSDLYSGPKYSCSHWMASSNKKLDNGFYTLEYFFNETEWNLYKNGDVSSSTDLDVYENFTVYCQFNYTRNTAYTLIESFQLDDASIFEYYSFRESYSYQESDIEWYYYESYRMARKRMVSIIRAMKNYTKGEYSLLKSYEWNNNIQTYDRKLISTCNFNTVFDRDFLIINLDDNSTNAVNPIFDDYTYTYFCPKVESVNIRGYQCDNQETGLYHGPSHLYVDSDYFTYYGCECEPWQDTAIYGEENFGRYSYSNSEFSCSESSYSITNWWIGQQIEPIANVSDGGDNNNNGGSGSNRPNGLDTGVGTALFLLGLIAAGVGIPFIYQKFCNADNKDQSQTLKAIEASKKNRNGIKYNGIPNQTTTNGMEGTNSAIGGTIGGTVGSVSPGAQTNSTGGFAYR